MTQKIVVAKFGGTSMATVPQILKAGEIVTSNPSCRLVVVSAPGARFDGDPKVTDLLIALQTWVEGIDPKQAFEQLRRRFEEIARGCGRSAGPLLWHISNAVEQINKHDFIKSRGEYFSAQVMARVLEFEFLDASRFIAFNSHGLFDWDETKKRWDALGLDLVSRKYVIPGFYGALPDGTIKTFSRGGSDITGAIVAALAQADHYQNWTDVSGVYTTDPRVVPIARPIPILSFTELRELASGGAGVLHPDVVRVLSGSGIPVHLRNTNNPQEPGTWIKPDANVSVEPGAITGVAGRTGYSIISVTKPGMNDEVGFLYQLLGVFARNGINIEHAPSGVDGVSVVLQSESVSAQLDDILKQVRDVCRIDDVRVVHNMALICVVGRGMAHVHGVLSRVSGALAEAGVNVRFFTQGASELSMIFGVEEFAFKAALSAVHDTI